MTKRIKTVGDLDSNYLRRVYLLCAVLTVVGAVWAFFTHGRMTALGILVGGSFGIINTILLGNVIRATIKSDEKDLVEVGLSFLLKFPVALGILILLLWQGWVDGIGFLIGFTLLLVSIVVALAIPHNLRADTKVSKEDNV